MARFPFTVTNGEFYVSYKVFSIGLACLAPLQQASVSTVPLFRGEVVCWVFFLGSFLCFLSRDMSGGQGSLLSKSAATRTGTDATHG